MEREFAKARCYLIHSLAFMVSMPRKTLAEARMAACNAMKFMDIFSGQFWCAAVKVLSGW